MSTGGKLARAMVELHLGDNPTLVPSVAQRPLHAYWSSLSATFRDTLLAPQRRADSGDVNFTWTLPASGSPSGLTASTAELATLRRKLREAATRFQQTGTGLPAATLTPLKAQMQQVVSDLVALPDDRLQAYLARTEAGWRLHSWGATRPGTPFNPDALLCEISGSVLVNGRPSADHTVVLENARDEIVGRQRTDDTGTFRFPKNSPGRYRVRVLSERVNFPVTGAPVTVDRLDVTGLELRNSSEGLQIDRPAAPGSSGRLPGADPAPVVTRPRRRARALSAAATFNWASLLNGRFLAGAAATLGLSAALLGLWLWLAARPATTSASPSAPAASNPAPPAAPRAPAPIASAPATTTATAGRPATVTREGPPTANGARTDISGAKTGPSPQNPATPAQPQLPPATGPAKTTDVSQVVDAARRNVVSSPPVISKPPSALGSSPSALGSSPSAIGDQLSAIHAQPPAPPNAAPPTATTRPPSPPRPAPTLTTHPSTHPSAPTPPPLSPPTVPRPSSTVPRPSSTDGVDTRPYVNPTALLPATTSAGERPPPLAAPGSNNQDTPTPSNTSPFAPNTTPPAAEPDTQGPAERETIASRISTPGLARAQALTPPTSPGLSALPLPTSPLLIASAPTLGTSPAPVFTELSSGPAAPSAAAPNPNASSAPVPAAPGAPPAEAQPAPAAPSTPFSPPGPASPRSQPLRAPSAPSPTATAAISPSPTRPASPPPHSNPTPASTPAPATLDLNLASAPATRPAPPPRPPTPVATPANAQPPPPPIPTASKPSTPPPPPAVRASDIRRITLTETRWGTQLRQDSIVPTAPVRVGESDPLENLRARLWQTRRQEQPRTLTAPQLFLGCTFTPAASASTAPPPPWTWRTAPPSTIPPVSPSPSAASASPALAPGTPLDAPLSALVARIDPTSARAEYTWPSPHPASPTVSTIPSTSDNTTSPASKTNPTPAYTPAPTTPSTASAAPSDTAPAILSDANGAELARVWRDPSGRPVVAWHENLLTCAIWVAATRHPADDQDLPPAEAQARFAWLRLQGNGPAALWRPDDPWRDATGHRFTHPIVADTGAPVITTLALLDSVTGWALVGELTLTSTYPGTLGPTQPPSTAPLTSLSPSLPAR